MRLENNRATALRPNSSLQGRAKPFDQPLIVIGQPGHGPADKAPRSNNSPVRGDVLGFAQAARTG